MKFTKLSLAAAGIALVSLFSFRSLFNGTVKGTVSPPDAAVRAWIVSATDTLKVPIDKGTFTIQDVKPGVYKVIIEAKPPYKNAAKDGITVADGQPSDVGEIKLSQ
ncbi:MAG TPA: carboxypeptidase-like regulatory domain-containing protein [Puia sp.]|nr:carboxypeptidase-like regulatory domain-containing protein [Puia sp.]